jgi:single-strand DNA-binding protein
MLNPLIITSGAASARQPVAGRQIALTKPPQFHIKNRISLMGFTGKDAEARTTKNQTPYAVLSLATKSSYKDKKSGEYVSHTEWHRIVVWGKLGEFASTLKKGMHLLVEGELRSREYTDKKNKDVQRRVWEVRADSILKLDRAEQAPPEDQLDAGPAEDEEPS